MNLLKTVLWIVALCVLLALLVAKMIPLIEVALTPPKNADRTGIIDNIKQVFSLGGVILLSSVIGLAQIIKLFQTRSAAAAADPHPRMVTWGWLTGFALALLLATGTIVYVNPRRYYGTNFYESSLLLTRWLKADLYNHLPAVPDIVIMGSSHAFQLSPQHITDTLGYSAFNAAVEGGNILDASVLTKYMSSQHDHTLPKVLFVELAAPLAYNKEQTAFHSPMSFIRYMDFPTAKLAIEDRVEGLFDLNQLAEAIFTARYYDIYRPPKRGTSFINDGYLDKKETKPELFDKQLSNQLKTGRTPACSSINQNGRDVIDRLLKLAEAHDSSIIFYSSPLHPEYYSRYRENRPAYIRCQTVFLEYMQNLMDAHHNVFYLDYSRLESIGGDETYKGFHDAVHMTEYNGNKLIDAAADTIRRAYAIATEQRVSP